MDPLDGIPEKILGYSVKTRWQISLNYLVPCIIELIVYISLMVVDSAVVYQHLLDRHYLNAWITLGVIFVPPVLTFFCVMISDQWPMESGCGSEKWKFFGRQNVNLLLFPICAVYRFSRKVFWCIESLFHEKNTYERHHALTKAAEHSPFELYHFLQSFFHSAPQIILQIFILLRDDMFRNYDTAFMQSISVILAFIKMAMTVESFQRFESQKCVGKNYPWLAPHQVHIRSTSFRRTLSAPGEISKNNAEDNSNLERKTMNVNENNFDSSKETPTKEIDFFKNITDDDKLKSMNEPIYDEIDASKHASTSQDIEPDDDLIENINEIKEYLRKTSADLELDSPILRHTGENFDRVPSLPPPPRPTSTKHPYLEKLNRLSTFKDMLIFNTENFIKEKVPRLPEGMFEHNQKAKEIKKENQTMSPASFTDETDILLPTRRKVVDGIESDDLVAKFISFLGWVMFLIMRIISLSVFSVFYLEICAWLCFAHYLLMLLCLINETRFKVKWQRTTFYFILAYIFIFNLMEFKVKFKNVRRWYVGYFLLVGAQNIAMTVVWYNFAVFLDSWWFEFMFLVIVQSGIMSLMCMILYFFYLKPKDKVFFVNE
ncbi:CLUMA_CG017985, isoform A [Clunio marinus]|uniref:XK-related protein n=1 Tax=Clunio marinus TaxID=568069 RepID=A0A1J1IY51_9DIPT|nr:CLUMA_CG017985, isoform A [Clunio marinus]